jgi:hypothetical protein
MLKIEYLVSLHNLLSYRLLTKNAKIKIYKTIILPVFFYRCEISSLKLKEDHRLSGFENSALRIISAPKRHQVIRGWRNLHMKSFIVCRPTFRQILLG